MTDIHVTVKFRNAALLRAIKKSGAKSVSQFCKKYNLAHSAVGELILLKASPLLKNGEWNKTAWDLSSALHCEPDDIFPTAATRRILVKREYSFEADSENLLTQGEMKALPVGVVKKLDNALNCLTPRQRDIVERRASGETYAEIGAVYNRSGARIRGIELKALRLLSHPARGLSRTMIEDVQSS
jgi:hypothetical protein